MALTRRFSPAVSLSSIKSPGTVLCWMYHQARSLPQGLIRCLPCAQPHLLQMGTRPCFSSNTQKPSLCPRWHGGEKGPSGTRAL